MNKRNKKIREFAKEHGFVHDFMTVGEYNDALQKFEKIAELIVRQCICLCDDENSQKYIAQKFGLDKELGLE